MVDNLKITIVREDGRSLILDDTLWLISKLDGIDGLDSRLLTIQNAQSNGQTITGNQLTGKDVTIGCMISQSLLNDFYRKQLLSFFTNSYTFKIYVRYMDNELWSEGHISKVVLPTLKMYIPITFEVTFKRESAYWHSLDNYSKNIASLTPLWGYPLFFPPSGAPSGKFDFTRTVTILNNGDVETSMRVVIKATGSVSNPYIMQNNKKVRVIDELVNGDTYEIDFDKVKILKNNETATGKLDRSSNFTDMILSLGENTISYGADVGENELSVTVFYDQLYNGV